MSCHCPHTSSLIAATAVALASVSVSAGPSDAGAPSPDGDTFRAAALQHGARASDADHAGIWKAAIPPGGTMQGEFANADPLGLSAGVSITADCSINWVDPDSRKRYCFSSATSLVVFLEAPHAYLARARENWERLRANANR
jgi:dihydroxyacid dehydratase/phosphogluconate dehydratase